MMNLWNERNHIFERTFPSFKPNVIFKFVVASTIFIFLGYFYIYVPQWSTLQWSTLHLQQTQPFLHLCTTVEYVAFTTNSTLFTSMYHSGVRCIYNKLNPFYIYVSQWSTLHLQQTQPFLHLCTTVEYVAFTTNSTLFTSMYHASNAFVTSAQPSPLNCMWSTLHLQQTQPFLHLCITVEYVAFTTNSTLLRMNKTTSAL